MTAPPASPRLMTVAEAVAVLNAEAVELRRPVGYSIPPAGLRLGDALIAAEDAPPWDKSQMDGYAVRSADLPGTLTIVGSLAAGESSTRPVSDGETVEIMTGAAVPPGADAVVPVEWTERRGGKVTIGRPVAVGNAIAPRGSDRPIGSTLLHAGRRIGAAQLAVLAHAGQLDPTLPLWGRPQVGVITTGDELVDPFGEVGPGRIRDVSGVMLTQLVRSLGGEAVRGEYAVTDTAAAVFCALLRSLPHAEVILITGGMSMGRYDFVPRVLLDHGFEFRVTKLRIKPGKPFVFAVRPARKSEDGRPRYAFGLPGNPVSAFVCTLVLASRLLARLGGGPADEFCREKVGVLTDPLGPNGDRQFYQPCRVDDGSAGRRVTPLAWRGSADVFTLAEADALIVRPEGDGPRAAGDAVTIVELPR